MPDHLFVTTYYTAELQPDCVGALGQEAKPGELVVITDDRLQLKWLGRVTTPPKPSARHPTFVTYQVRLLGIMRHGTSQLDDLSQRPSMGSLGRHATAEETWQYVVQGTGSTPDLGG